jgi:hypothetical protein
VTTDGQPPLLRKKSRVVTPGVHSGRIWAVPGATVVEKIAFFGPAIVTDFDFPAVNVT